MVAAVITGITNATSGSLNRLAKLEARLACGFRNPVNQRRRVGIARARGYRRRSRTAATSRTRTVTGRKPRSWLTSKARISWAGAGLLPFPILTKIRIIGPAFT